MGLPYGCSDGACGSCKCRMLEGRVIHGAHQQKALSPEEELSGLILTCQAAPQSDVVIEARTVPGAGEFAIRKLPSRVISIDKPAPDVAILKLQLPANDPFQYRAGQYVEFILRDGSRRSYSMAKAPHDGRRQAGDRAAPAPPARRQVHRPRVRRDEGKGHPARRRARSAASSCARTADKPMVLLASGTGLAPIKAIVEHMIWKGSERKAVLYWGCRSKVDLYLNDWAEEAARRTAQPALRAGALGSEARRRLDGPHRPGPPGGDARPARPSAHWQVYACGAPIMVESAQRDFVARCGLPDDEFYADSFTSEADKHGPTG